MHSQSSVGRVAVGASIGVLLVMAGAPAAHAAEHSGTVGTGGCVSWSYQDDWSWMSGVEVYLHNHCSRPCGVIIKFNDGRMDDYPMDPRQSRTDWDVTTSGLVSIHGDSDILDGRYICPDS